MEVDRKEVLRAKLVVKAFAWLECRNLKNGSTGAEREKAKTKQRTAEHELADATEQFQKEQ